MAGEKITDLLRPAVELDIAAGLVAAVEVSPVCDVIAAEPIADVASCSWPPSTVTASARTAVATSSTDPGWRGLDGASTTGSHGGDSTTVGSAVDRTVSTTPGRRGVVGVRTSGRGATSGSVRVQVTMGLVVANRGGGTTTRGFGVGGSSATTVGSARDVTMIARAPSRARVGV